MAPIEVYPGDGIETVAETRNLRLRTDGYIERLVYDADGDYESSYIDGDLKGRDGGWDRVDDALRGELELLRGRWREAVREGDPRDGWERDYRANAFSW